MFILSSNGERLSVSLQTLNWINELSSKSLKLLIGVQYFITLENKPEIEGFNLRDASKWYTTWINATGNKAFSSTRSTLRGISNSSHQRNGNQAEECWIKTSMVTESSDQVSPDLRTAHLEKRCQSTDAPKLCWYWKTPDEVSPTQECSTSISEIHCICWLTERSHLTLQTHPPVLG